MGKLNYVTVLVEEDKMMLAVSVLYRSVLCAMVNVMSLALMDLNSSNFTFVAGTKLHPFEFRR